MGCQKRPKLADLTRAMREYFSLNVPILLLLAAMLGFVVLRLCLRRAEDHRWSLHCSAVRARVVVRLALFAERLARGRGKPPNTVRLLACIAAIGNRAELDPRASPACRSCPSTSALSPVPCPATLQSARIARSAL
jgi:hypothetical protein